MSYGTKTLETLNPFESLKQEQAHSEKPLDFRIIDFKLLCSSIKPAKREIYERKDFDLFNVDEFFVKSYNSIVQKFIIEIYPKTKKLTFSVSLKTNANLTHLKAHIICMDDFTYYPGLKFDILQNIYKAMVKERILIIRLDKNLFEKLDKFIQAVKENNATKELELFIAQGVDKIEHKSDEIIYHRNVDEACSDEKSNYDEGDYCKPVQKDELLFEYIFKIMGKEGRNLRGEILHLNPINFLNNPFKLKDQSIYAQELEDRIKYFSVGYGFLNKDHTGYSVTSSLKVGQVGLKTTGSIKTDINENVNLEISNHDEIEDAIKSGIVNLQVSNIKVNGSIGATKIHGKNFSIKGLTHAKSEIYGENAFIHTHKGYIEADTVYIKNLEHGRVIAKNVFVEKSMGAKIEAENIYICNLLTDNILYPRKNLIIANNLKFKNHINISPLSENLTDNEYDNIKNLSIKIKNKLNETIKQMQNLYDYLVKNQVKIIQIKKRQKAQLVPLETKFLSLYDGVIEKYNKLNFLYTKLIKLKYQVDVKLNFLEEMIYEIKIYIKAEEIGEDNLLYFYPKGDKKLERKHVFTLRDCEKVFYLDKEKNHIDSQRNYDENKIEEIKSIFEELARDNL